jgi:hypothetical protein
LVFKYHSCINYVFAGISEDQHGILLLQCCGDLLSDELPASRIDLVHKIWDNLQELGMWHAAVQCKIEISFIHILVTAYSVMQLIRLPFTIL